VGIDRDFPVIDHLSVKLKIIFFYAEVHNMWNFASIFPYVRVHFYLSTDTVHVISNVCWCRQMCLYLCI